MSLSWTVVVVVDPLNHFYVVHALMFRARVLRISTATTWFLYIYVVYMTIFTSSLQITGEISRSNAISKYFLRSLIFFVVVVVVVVFD